MKVILIGTGAIANALLKNATENVILSQYGIRILQKNSEKWLEFIKETVSADVVIYLAYHKQNMLANFSILSKLLYHFSQKKWKGRFVFFNTQLALPARTFSSENARPSWLRCDTYSCTKRIQSMIINANRKQLCISELFLPIVVGSGTQWSERLTFIAQHSIINLPDKGNAICAWIDVDVFSGWIWNIFLNHENLEKIFLYGQIGSFENLLKTISKNSDCKNFIIKDFKHRFTCSSSWKVYCLTTLKNSPVALLMTFASQLASRIQKQKNMTVDTNVKFVHCHGDVFTPEGGEYMFFSEHLNIDSLPCEAKKIA